MSKCEKTGGKEIGVQKILISYKVKKKVNPHS